MNMLVICGRRLPTFGKIKHGDYSANQKTNMRIIGSGTSATFSTNGMHVTSQNTPRNTALSLKSPYKKQAAPSDLVEETVVALSFSGGGLRAAAYAYGVLEGLNTLPSRKKNNLIDDVTFITSVSGGSITAAYFGLHGKDSFHDFRERVLSRDGEADLRFSLFNPLNIARLLSGGLNDRENLRGWLENDVFRGATYADMFKRGKPEVWINASNIYHRLAFPFHERVFDMLCSDLSALPVSEAVYASMAVPIFFAPAVIEKHPERCQEPLPTWVRDVNVNANDYANKNNSSAENKLGTSRPTPLLMRAVARAILDFRSIDNGRYVKLIDGGVTDNFGLAAILQSRLALGTPYGPLTKRDAVKLRRMLFIVVDAGQILQGDWNKTVAGPSGFELATAAIDTAIDANSRANYDAFQTMMSSWEKAIVQYRCGLSADEAKQLGATENWRCDDVKLTLTRIAFDALEPQRAAALASIPTRLKLSEKELDALITAGRETVQRNSAVREFVNQLSSSP